MPVHPKDAGAGFPGGCQRPLWRALLACWLLLAVLPLLRAESEAEHHAALATCRAALDDHVLTVAEFPAPLVQEVWCEDLALLPPARLEGMRREFLALATFQGQEQITARQRLASQYFAPDLLAQWLARPGLDPALQTVGAELLQEWQSWDKGRYPLPTRRSLAILERHFLHLPPLPFKVGAYVRFWFLAQNGGAGQAYFDRVVNPARPTAPPPDTVPVEVHRDFVLAFFNDYDIGNFYAYEADQHTAMLTPKEWRDPVVIAFFGKALCDGRVRGKWLRGVLEHTPADLHWQVWDGFAQDPGYHRGPMACVRLRLGDASALPEVKAFFASGQNSDQDDARQLTAWTSEMDLLTLPFLQAQSGSLGAVAVAKMAAAAKDQHRNLRDHVEPFLGQPEVTAALRACLDKGDVCMRVCAAELLLRTGEPVSDEQLLAITEECSREDLGIVEYDLCRAGSGLLADGYLHPETRAAHQQTLQRMAESMAAKLVDPKATKNADLGSFAGWVHDHLHPAGIYPDIRAVLQPEVEAGRAINYGDEGAPVALLVADARHRGDLDAWLAQLLAAATAPGATNAARMLAAKCLLRAGRLADAVAALGSERDTFYRQPQLDFALTEAAAMVEPLRYYAARLALPENRSHTRDNLFLAIPASAGELPADLRALLDPATALLFDLNRGHDEGLATAPPLTYAPFDGYGDDWGRRNVLAGLCHGPRLPRQAVVALAASAVAHDLQQRRERDPQAPEHLASPGVIVDCAACFAVQGLVPADLPAGDLDWQVLLRAELAFWRGDFASAQGQYAAISARVAKDGWSKEVANWCKSRASLCAFALHDPHAAPADFPENEDPDRNTWWCSLAETKDYAQAWAWFAKQPLKSRCRTYSDWGGTGWLYLAWLAATANDLPAARQQARLALIGAYGDELAQQAAQLCHWLDAADAPEFAAYLAIRRTWQWPTRAATRDQLARFATDAKDPGLRALAAWQAASLTLELGGDPAAARTLWQGGAGGDGPYAHYCTQALAAVPAAQQRLQTVNHWCAPRSSPSVLTAAYPRWGFTGKPNHPVQIIESGIFLDNRGLAFSAARDFLAGPGEGWCIKLHELYLPPGRLTLLTTCGAQVELHACVVTPWWAPPPTE